MTVGRQVDSFGIEWHWATKGAADRTVHSSATRVNNSGNLSYCPMEMEHVKSEIVGRGDRPAIAQRADDWRRVNQQQGRRIGTSPPSP